MLDVVIAGGGPAGLSAALLLGRARRSVLLCDSGQPRNAGVHAMHGFLSRDGMDPAALRQAVRDQLLVVLASDPRNFQLALQLTRWSPDVLLASNGPAGLDDDARRLLAAP